jgi:hypothetical protein
MNQNHNSLGRTIFQLAIAVAAIALVLSISRMFISQSERSGPGSDFFAYDLTIPSQMVAFLSVVVMSIVAIGIGTYLKKSYEVLSAPLVGGGLVTLIFITVLAYFGQIFGRSGYYGETFAANEVSAQLVLTLVIAIEWIGLIWVCSKQDQESKEVIPPVEAAS